MICDFFFQCKSARLTTHSRCICVVFHETKCSHQRHTSNFESIKVSWISIPFVTSVGEFITTKIQCLVHLYVTDSPFQNKPLNQWLIFFVVTSSAAISQSAHSCLFAQFKSTIVRNFWREYNIKVHNLAAHNPPFWWDHPISSMLCKISFQNISFKNQFKLSLQHTQHNTNAANVTKQHKTIGFWFGKEQGIEKISKTSITKAILAINTKLLQASMASIVAEAATKSSYNRQIKIFCTVADCSFSGVFLIRGLMRFKVLKQM